LGSLLGSAFCIAAGYALVRGLLATVHAGDGGKLFRTGWGYKTSAYAALVTGAILLGTPLVGLLLAWIGRRDERDFLRRYGQHRENDPRSRDPR
jgi:hypothetical protein